MTRNTIIPQHRRIATIAFSCALVAALSILTLTHTTRSRKDLQAHRHLGIVHEGQGLPSLFPFSWPRDYLGFGFTILGLLLAAGGGMGGGGIIVPIYILILDFPVKNVAALASITVLGGAIANNLINVRNVHPDHPERPAIDWDLMLLLQPMTIAGALIGIDLNKLLPEILLLVLLVTLLAVTARETMKIAHEMHRDEEMRLAQGNASPAIALMEKQKQIEPEIIFHNQTNDGLESELIKAHCISAAIKLASVFFVVLLFSLLQGASDRFGGISLRTCKWVVEVFVVLGLVLFSFYARFSILERQNIGGPILSAITWDERNTIVYPLISVVAGLVSGIFGIGGGIVSGPLMLALGVHPQVVSATSACMILFTSFISTLWKLTFGFLKYDYAVFCIGLGFVSTLVGQIVTTRLLKRTGNRSSYIAFCISAVVAISAVAMGIESVIAIIES